MRHHGCTGFGCPICVKFTADPVGYADAIEKWTPSRGLDAVDLLPGLPDPLPEAESADLPELWAEHAGHKQWAKRADVQTRHREAFFSLIGGKVPYPDRAEGDGIVVVGGGQWWPMIATAIRMAREVTDLPVQVWHRGWLEPVFPAELSDVAGVTYHDSTAYPSRVNRGWEAKSLALLHCGLERVLFMDADAYLVGNPQPWLEAATPECPFVFWQDLPTQDSRIDWPAFGLNKLSSSVPVQGGQLAIHRRAMWRTLVLFHWLNSHSDYYYVHGFGDQDCWPPAMVATGIHSKNLGTAPWVPPLYVLPFKDEPLIVHRSKCKWWGLPDDARHTWAPMESKAWGFLQKHPSRYSQKQPAQSATTVAHSSEETV